jgi:hypothetical protein
MKERKLPKYNHAPDESLVKLVVARGGTPHHDGAKR